MMRSMSSARRPASSMARRAAFGRQVAGRDTGLGQAPLADAGAFDDPGVRRLDVRGGQLGGQIVIGYDARRQIAAGTGNHRILRSVIHQAESPAARGMRNRPRD